MDQHDGFHYSEVYLKANASADAWGFYLDFVFYIVVTLCYTGWFTVRDYPIKSVAFTYMVALLAMRWTQFRRPAFYLRWRLAFVRMLRYLKMCHVLGFLPFNFHHFRHYTEDMLRAFVEEHSRSFLYHKVPVPTVISHVRLVLWTNASVLGMAEIQRFLPWKEQAFIQLVYLLAFAAWARRPASFLLEMPEHVQGIKQLCQHINRVAYFNPILLLLPQEDVDALVPDGCSVNAAQRVVIFFDVVMVFLLPMYVTIVRELRLYQKYVAACIAARRRRHGLQVGQTGGWAWWQRALLDAGLLAYLCAVTWRCMVDYEVLVVWGLELFRVNAERGLAVLDDWWFGTAVAGA